MGEKGEQRREAEGLRLTEEKGEQILITRAHG